jgi:transcriptional regulator with XRE-family HTH domain
LARVAFPGEKKAHSLSLLVANYPQMNFTQMHERLRLELLRRINRGTLSVSLLARQTGYGQAHLSNFLHSRRQLSLEALDRVLAAQYLAATDLLPLFHRVESPSADGESGSVPIVSHPVALFERYIRPATIHSMLHLPAGVLKSLTPHAPRTRTAWQRFVAVRIAPTDAVAMEPLVMPDAIVLIDRHYNSLRPYRPDKANIYAVRQGAHLRVRYAEFLSNRLVLRPHNIAFPVELIELDPEQAPGDLIAGRVALIVNEL